MTEPKGSHTPTLVKRHGSQPRVKLPAALASRASLSGGELRPTGSTKREKTHRQGRDPVPYDTRIGSIREISDRATTHCKRRPSNAKASSVARMPAVVSPGSQCRADPR